MSIERALNIILFILVILFVLHLIGVRAAQSRPLIEFNVPVPAVPYYTYPEPYYEHPYYYYHNDRYYWQHRRWERERRLEWERR